MPWKPKSICNYPGCQTLTYDRYCEKHKKEMIRTQNDRSSKMYTYQWRKVSKEFLKKHPLCVHCEREGRLIPATEVDHIKPHGGDRKLFWNKNNWQPLCKSCHSKKTAEEDGGFGNNPNPARG
jgi:5-methylcytosine-specific restriction protein A